MAAIELSNDAQSGTLQAGTFFFGLGGDAALISGAHYKWDSALVAVITFERATFPDVALNSVVAGDWVQTNPSTAQIDVVTGSATVSNATITIPGGTAGGATVDFGNNGQRRIRTKVVVATPGFLRVRPNGKE